MELHTLGLAGGQVRAGVTSDSGVSRRGLRGRQSAAFGERGGARDPRRVVEIVRAALDGLSCVGPIGDPNTPTSAGRWR
jgi:hypothetical protein